MNSHQFCLRACDGGRRGSVWHKSSCQWWEMSWEKITVKVVLLKLKGNKGLHVTKTCLYFFLFLFPNLQQNQIRHLCWLRHSQFLHKTGEKRRRKCLIGTDASSIHFLFPLAWSFMKSAALQDSLLFLNTATAWKPSLLLYLVLSYLLIETLGQTWWRKAGWDVCGGGLACWHKRNYFGSWSKIFYSLY